MPVASGVVLAIRLRFHNHAPQQLAIRLAFHQQAADEVGGNQLGGASEEGLGEGWEVLAGLGGYESGYVWMCCGMVTGLRWQAYKWKVNCAYWRCQKSNSQH
jgi:hypothetical protein